jgi:hypothetical protein
LGISEGGLDLAMGIGHHDVPKMKGLLDAAPLHSDERFGG